MKTYDQWAKFNVEEELRQCELSEVAERKAKQLDQQNKQKQQFEQQFSQCTEEEAAISQAQAAVAALKKKKTKQTKPNEPTEQLQQYAELMALKQQQTRLILTTREKATAFLLSHKFQQAIVHFTIALEHISILEEKLPLFQCFSQSEHQPKHEPHTHHEDSCCCKDEKHKDTTLPQLSNDLPAVLQMFRSDCDLGIARAQASRKHLADATESYKKVLLGNKLHVLAWLERGRIFREMNAPLLTVLHANHLLTLEKDHDEANEEIDLATESAKYRSTKTYDELIDIEIDKLNISDHASNGVSGEQNLRRKLSNIKLLRDEADVVMVEGLFFTALIKYAATLKLLQSLQNKGLVIKQSCFACHINIANCYIEMDKNYAKAICHLNQALLLHPSSISALFRRGKLYRLSQRYSEALRDLNQAQDLNKGLCNHLDAQKKDRQIAQEIDRCKYDQTQFDRKFLQEQLAKGVEKKL